MSTKKAFGIGLGILCACLVGALIYLISTNGTTNSSSSETTTSSSTVSIPTSPSTVSTQSTSPSTVSTSPVVSYVNNSSFVNAICPSTTIPNSTRVLN